MKQLKPVLIAAGACLLLAAALVLVLVFWPKEAEVIEFVPAEGDMLMIIDKSPTSVQKAEFKTDTGEKFTIEFSLDENGNQIAKLIGGEEELVYNDSTMYDLAGRLGFMSAIQAIPDANDKDFGFNKPRREIKISYTDGVVIKLEIGKDAPTGDGAYLKRKDTGDVYLIGGDVLDYLMKTLHDYRVFSLYGPYEDPYTISKISIERAGQDKLIVQAKSSTSTESASNALYEIISPVQTDADNDLLVSLLLQPLIDVKAESLIEDNPKDLSKYGLDRPSRVEFEDKNGKTVAFLIGASGENGGNYVMVEKSNSVVLTEKPITFTTVDYTNLMLKLIWYHHIDAVSSIQYQFADEKTHDFIITNASPAAATYDGTTISNENTNRLFRLTNQFTLQGKIDSSMKYGEPMLTINMKLKNGSTTTLQLAEINERHYAAIIDGTARYYVNVTQLNALLSGFDTLASGGTIPEID